MGTDLGRVIDGLPSMVWTMLPDGQVQFFNRRWTEFTGLDKDNDRAWRWQDAIEPEDLPKLLDWWRAAQVSGEAREIEGRILRRQGGSRNFLIQCNPVYDDNGTIAEWCTVATNIEAFTGGGKPHPSGLDFQQVIDSIPVQVAVTTPTGEVEGHNKLTLAYFGKTFDELKEWKASDVVHPDDLKDTIAAQRAAHIAGTSYNVESRHLRADGVYRWHNVLGLPLRNDAGEIQRWLHLLIDIEDRKRAENALVESERQSRLAVSSIPGLVVMFSPDGHLESTSDQTLDYVGQSFDDFRNWATNGTMHPDDLKDVLPQFAHALASGEPYEYEVRIKRRDGVYRWFHIRGNPTRDAVGKIVRWYGLMTDVDDRRRAEEALRQSERQLRQIVSTIPGLIVAFAPDGRLEGANAQTLGYVGQTLNEFKNWSTNGSVHPEDLSAAIASFAEALASGQPYDFEVRIRRHDGVFRWFQVRGNPSRDADGNIVRWYGLMIDIHDRKQAEIALADNERESRLVVHTVAGMVALFTPDGHLNGGNQQLLDYFQQPLEEVANWATNGITHPDDLQHCIDTFSRSVISGEPYDYETRFRRHDGVYRWFQVRGHPLRDANGQIIRWYGLLTDIDDRRRAADELSENQRQLELVVNTIPGLIVIITPDGIVEGVNDQALSYVGYSLDEFKDWQTNDIVHPDDLPETVAAFLGAIASGQAYEVEERVRRHDGVYRWFQVRGNPVRDASGVIRRWYFLLIDIDDRKRTEIALADSERESRLIVQTVAGMVALFTPDGHLNGGNQQLLDYFQQPLEEVANWATNGITHPDDLQHCIDEFTRSLVTGEPYNFETRFRRYDGVYRWFLIRGHPLHDASGRIVRWYGLLTDIDDRKHTEEELRRSQTFLATGQRISQTGTFSWRVGPDQVTFSDELYRIFDFEEGTVVTLDMVVDRVHPDDRATLSEKMARVRNGFDNAEYEIRLRRPDGGVKFVRVIGRVIQHRDGRKESLGAVQDVTERRLAEEARDQLRTELSRVTGIMSLGQMAASIAHEVNQPLAGIIANATTCLHMLSLEPPNLDIALETTRRTLRDGNRAADVIARLRALFSKRQIVFEALDLNEAVREVIALSSGDLQRSRVLVKTEFDPALPKVIGDRVQLQQVIMNLLRNASEAVGAVADRQRLIEIRTDIDEDSEVRVAIRDNGAGFGQYDTQRMFEAFYTTKSDGMGIGLSVSRSIIETHNGRLWAETNDGPGVTLYFCVPQFFEEEMNDLPPRDGALHIAENEMRTS